MEEARTESASAVAQAIAKADSSAKAAAASQELALSTATQDLEGARESLVEREARVEKVERALADKVNKREVYVLLYACFLVSFPGDPSAVLLLLNSFVASSTSQ